MTKTWEAIADDKLQLNEKTVSFLQSEFCPAGIEPIWSEEYFKWKLTNINPAGSGFMSVALFDNHVIGTVSLTRKRILINGTEYMGGEVGDSYSSTLYRRRIRCSTLSSYDTNPDSYINKTIFGRLASDIRARAELNGISIIYGTPNKNAYPGWTKRLDYFDLLTYDNRSFVRPTVHFIIGKAPFLKSLSGFMYAAESLLLIFSKLVYFNKSMEILSYKELMPSVEEIDFLWNQVKPTNGFSLIRDAAYWVHRYIKHPLASYSIYSIYKDNELVGLVVTREIKTITGKLIVYIVEWLINDLIVPLEYLLYNLINIYKNGEIEALIFYGNGSLQKVNSLFKYGFLKDKKIPIIFANTPDAQLVKTFKKEFQFHIGSSDAF